MFCKAGTARQPEAEDLLRSLNLKYDSFANAAELTQRIRVSLGHHLLSLIRGEATAVGQLEAADHLKNAYWYQAKRSNKVFRRSTASRGRWPCWATRARRKGLRRWRSRSPAELRDRFEDGSNHA